VQYKRLMQVDIGKTDPKDLCSAVALRGTSVAKSRGERLYSQGEDADAVFYVFRGYVKLTVLSGQGKEAVVGILGRRSFLGHACLSGRPLREATATAICDCTVTKIDRSDMSRLLDEEPSLRRLFLSYVLDQNVQLEADLADHLFNPCEVRLARALARLAAIDVRTGSTSLLSNIDQQTLAGMVGTTQPRISVLLSRFKKKGLIRYEAGLQVDRAHELRVER
jgi:CRP/FNR family transcriptional regulator, cyclic AMP receptor protein